jgi:hypothetical protein
MPVRILPDYPSRYYFIIAYECYFHIIANSSCMLMSAGGIEAKTRLLDIADGKLTNSCYQSPMRPLCGLVVRVLGYRSRGPGSIPSTNRRKVVGLERGPLSLVSTTEEQLDRKVAAIV